MVSTLQGSKRLHKVPGASRSQRNIPAPCHISFPTVSIYFLICEMGKGAESTLLLLESPCLPRLKSPDSPIPGKVQLGTQQEAQLNLVI